MSKCILDARGFGCRTGVDRRKLFNDLEQNSNSGITRQKLPPLFHSKNETYEFRYLSLYDRYVDFIVRTVVRVTLSFNTVKPKRSKSRIFVMCPKCFKFIPFGRYIQHIQRKDHKE